MSGQAIKISVRDVTKVFGPRPASALAQVRAGRSKDEILRETGHTVGLNRISLDVREGEIFVIMGLSGSGKSTLIRHFNRLIDPTAGVIEVNGRNILEMRMKELEDFRRQTMSMVFQNFGLLPHRTVIDNVAFGLEIQKIGRRRRHDKAAEWIDAVGLAGYEGAYPAALSGGMRQRVGLARALCTDPEILLMDEAFSALDPLIRSEMQDQLVSLQSRLGKTIVFITHDLDEALRIGDRIAILKDGALSQIGTPADILLEPADDYVAAFVRDVNRGRALCVEAIMRPPALRLTSETIDEALSRLRSEGASHGYLVRNGHLEGVVTAESLVSARAEGMSDISRAATVVPTVLMTEPIEGAVPLALESQSPVAVVCEKGLFQGVVEADDMAHVLARQPEPEQDNTAGSPNPAPVRTA